MERLEELAQRARRAESKSLHLSQPGSPNPGSARSAGSGSHRESAQDPSAPPSAGMRSSQRSPLPPVPVNAEYYDENGATIRVYKGNVGTIDLRHDPFSDRQSISTEGSGQQSMHNIPIQYIPSSTSDEDIPKKRPVSQAARTLDEARKNLFRPGHAPPRPARSPDLDLRLNPPADSAGLKSPTLSNDYRDSYLSGNSGAASFLSSSTDLHFDAPKIVTSKQVHVGRVQQAEVVQMGQGRLLSPDGTRGEHFDAQSGSTTDLQAPPSPGTFGPRSSGGIGSEVSGAASGSTSYRTLTPTSGRYEDDARLQEGQEPSTSGTTDLRFSMGSLAYRDSISTLGTGRFLAQAQPHVPPPRSGMGAGLNLGAGPRESMASGKSGSDSVLGAFPMIPPSQFPSSMSTSGLPSLPQSTSVSTLDHAALVSRPPPAYRPVPPSSQRGMGHTPNHTPSRNTTHSVADSFLGTFPFVPPNEGNLDTLPMGVRQTAGPTSPTSPPAGAERIRHGLSTTSEALGLGGFDFSFEGAPPMPEQPVRRK